MAHDILEQVNPFTDQYWEKEVEFYGAKPYQFGSLEIKLYKPMGRCDEYFNVAFNIYEVEVPGLFIDNQLWMSITKMEVQSLHIPIQRAHGKVGVIGLGLGYSTLATMKKPEVEQITVFEIDPRVVWYFIRHFHHRKGYEKLRIVTGDALKTCKDFEFDFFFCDRYVTICCDEMLEDISHFKSQNKIEVYHPWGLELCYFVAIQDYYVYGEVPHDILEFIMFWHEGPGSNLKAPMCDVDYSMELIKEVGNEF